MKRILVYDIPLRLFHWLFAGLFLFAFVIAKTVDDESPIYSYHMMAGLTLSFLVFLRIIWGLVGSTHSKFTGFSLSPVHLFEYFQGILTGSKKLWTGHNPASSWASIIMFFQALGLGITGYLMTSGGGAEAFEDIHELLANSFILVVIFHVAGIILHTIRHKDPVAMSMIDGTKTVADESGSIKSAHSFVGLFFIALVIAFAGLLFKNFDSQTQQLKVFGVTLQLGENEGGEGGESGESGEQDGAGENGKAGDGDDDGDDD
jgi:cytochrome b